jgi:malate/lactate dehydrogenase
MQGVGPEIVFVDKNEARAEAEADDIRRAVPFANPLNVRAGDYSNLASSRVVLLCSGVGQKRGETRLHLLQRNAQVFPEVVPAIGGCLLETFPLPQNEESTSRLRESARVIRKPSTTLEDNPV